ncbi:MAG TPA: hypothetical protein VHM90_06375 [Phycisphaerae bacterium]|nr:hypothetical protein [Phycisphaerae bacterium]
MPLRALRALLVSSLAFAALAQSKPATTPATAPRKPTLAVLPFIAATGDTKEEDLAARMRFAVSQKLSTDTNAVAANGAFDRMDNLQLDNLVSALQISFAGKSLPDDDDMQKLLAALETDFTITGTVKGRTLTLTLYQKSTPAKTATAEIPPDSTSPKLTVEKIVTDLTGTAFAHIRDTEVDHSDPKVEARAATRPNLVPDPAFDLAARDPKKLAVNWNAILAAEHYAPPLLTPDDAKNLAPDRVAVVPKSASGLEGDGTCLQLRVTRGTAEMNGLACESTWIPVEANKKYRFAASYHSDAPTLRVFLKGFATKSDQFGDKNDPEAVRREFYRAQVLPRERNGRWELIEMDFTPSTLKPTDPKIEWIKVDFLAYLRAGNVFIDDVSIKKIDE